jgi:hypothetical protein
MGTGGNFEDKLQLVKDPDNPKDIHVEAKGPAYGDVVELCVWIIQKKPGAGDAAATQITTITGRAGLTSPKLADGSTGWGLLARQVSTRPLEAGPATAMAIALFLEEEDGEQKAQFWAESVELMAPKP